MKQTRQKASKLAAHLGDLIDQRDRLEDEAYTIARTTDVRLAGPVLSAFGTIIRFLDDQIDRIRITLGEK